TGIYLCNASDVFVENNRIFVDSPYPNAIEYRFKGSRDNLIRGNETNRKIVSRNGGQAVVISNKIDPGFRLAVTSPPAGVKAPAREVPKAVTAPRADTRPESIRTDGIQAFHQSGQTFITFGEAVNPFPAGTTYGQYHAGKEAYRKKYRYRLYRASKPITSVKGLTPLADIPSFSGINAYFYGKNTAKKHGSQPLIRYVVKSGSSQLPAGIGLHVFTPGKPGSAYYAVTTVTKGQEDTRIVPGKNATRHPVKETQGKGIPVRQRIERPESFTYVKGPALHFYTRWETPPNAAVDGKPFDYLVGIPANLAKPASVGIHMHGWGRNLLKGYAWWQNATKGAILLASNQDPYDWWTGYREDYFNGSSSREKKPVIRPYTTSRLLSFVDWLKSEGKWQIDLSRTFTAGVSMGGSGSIMMALRYPDRIAWNRSWVGVHKPLLSPQFKSSYEKVWGKPGEGLLFENGEKVWEYYDDTVYLGRHPDKDVGLICFSNGKNDAGIGWKQAVLFLNALQKARQPHIFAWGQAGHGQRAAMPKDAQGHTMPIDISTRLSLPAFTNCSLDDNPGNGDPADGASEGQVNQWLYWETKNIVDKTDRWEITVGLTKKSPAGECRVDITPRRLQRFKAAPKEIVGWELRSFNGTTLDRGKVVVDHWGLVTVEGVRVTRAKNRLVLTKQP
ncbi:MAG: hypothetical protein MI802_13875, partial [Desulfobacterales bacterium]|nr:hypothetical protein [Desulfobacterales bacterium]